MLFEFDEKGSLGERIRFPFWIDRPERTSVMLRLLVELTILADCVAPLEEKNWGNHLRRGSHLL